MAKQPPVSITGVWLRTIGDRVQVLLEIAGQWRLINDERLGDGAKTIISHITEPGGILKCPVDPVTAGAE
jgi:hypothetical protein